MCFNPADILRTSDELSHVLDRYETWERNASRQPAPSSQLQGAALDLLDLGPSISQPQVSPNSALDDQLLSLGKIFVQPKTKPKLTDDNFSGLYFSQD